MCRVDINDRHYFNIFFMDARHQTIFSIIVSTDKDTYVGTMLVGGPFSSQFLQTEMCLPVESRHEKTGFLPRRKQRRRSASQLRRSNCEADQRLCFRYVDSTIPVLS